MAWAPGVLNDSGATPTRIGAPIRRVHSAAPHFGQVAGSPRRTFSSNVWWHFSHSKSDIGMSASIPLAAEAATGVGAAGYAGSMPPSETPLPLRLPLASGRSGWRSRALFAGLIAPASLALVWVVTVAAPALDVFFDLPWIGDLAGALIGLGLAGTGFLIAASTLELGAAQRALPSDVVTVPADSAAATAPDAGTTAGAGATMLLRGGQHGGTRLDRAALASLAVTTPAGASGPTELRHGDRLLASAISADERRGLDAAVRVMRALAARGGNGAAPPYAPGQPADAVLRLLCGSCGAPATPDDADVVPCPACAAAVPVPAALRARVVAGRLASTVDAANTRALARLATLPPAEAVGWQVRLGGWAMVAVWPLLYLALGYLGERRSWGNAALVLVIGVSAVIALYYAVLPRLVARQAFPVLVGELAARRHDGVDACRTCGAPLPATAASPRATVVRCASCDSDNLVGAHLVQPDAARALAQSAQALLPALAHWRADLRHARQRQVVAVVVLAAAIAGFVATAPAARAQRRAAAAEASHTRATTRCRAGWLTACNELAPAEADALLAAGCTGGATRACTIQRTVCRRAAWRALPGCQAAAAAAPRAP